MDSLFIRLNVREGNIGARWTAESLWEGVGKSVREWRKEREGERRGTWETPWSIYEKWLRARLEEPTRNLIRVRTYVPVAGTGRARASCIFSVFVAGVQLRVTHCARLLAAFASPRRDGTRERTKIGVGCIFVRKPRATGEEGAPLSSRFPCTDSSPFHPSPRAHLSRLNA